jgi:DnaJ-class molecular chaperone
VVLFLLYNITMDYYSQLGLQRGASDDDIKKAYRSMAMKHHPDRGGDEQKFKEISTAYEALTNPEKKRIIDMGGDPNAQPGMGGFHHGGNPFEFHFNSGNFDDIFGGFGFGRQPMRRNKSFNINVEVTLEDILTGKDLNAEISTPGGKNKIINIHIPAGIEHGQQIRYEGMGDHAIPNLRPGDLLVNVVVRPHHEFSREGSTILTEKEISVWDAILGTSINIETLDKKTLSIAIPAGTQPETVMRVTGEGLPQMRSRQRGHLLVKIKVTIPKNINNEQVEKIKELKNGI